MKRAAGRDMLAVKDQLILTAEVGFTYLSLLYKIVFSIFNFFSKALDVN